MIRQLLRSAVVFYLILPFLFLFYQFGFQSQISWSEVWWAFKNSVFQAFFSAVGSVFLGLWVAFGLLSFRSRSKARRGLEMLSLTPNFLPTLFVLLSAMVTIPAFPMGLPGIIIVHTLINFGLVGVVLAQRAEEQVGRLVEVSYVMGASRLATLTRVVFPLLKKDILAAGLFVFVICFSSFSVPLIVGGGKGTTLEVLIYEKLRLSSEWSGAVIIATLQSVFIFLVSLLMLWRGNSFKVQKDFEIVNLRFISFRSGVLVLMAISLTFFMGYLKPFWASPEQVWSFYRDIGDDLPQKIAGTLVISLVSGLLVFMGLMLIAYLHPSRWFSRFLSSYMAPSTVLACFAFLVLLPNTELWPYFKIPGVLFLLSITGLFRIAFSSALENLSQQQKVAWLLGASPGMIFRWIYLPQLVPVMALLSGLAAVWACGDYAVSRILATRTLSLSMMTDSLMSGYRLHQAVYLSGFVLLISLLVFLLVAGGLYVLGQRLKTAKE